MVKDQEKICERNLFSAYVDGELDAGLTLLFEDHLEECVECRAELRAHRLFVCELDAAMAENIEMPVPQDFSRMVAARAASDMRGVRTRSEHRKALTICAVLALVGFALLGAAARESVFMIAERFVGTVFSLVSFVAGTAYDTVAGFAVVFRVVSRKVIIDSGSLGPLVGLFALAILILSRLISNYHRTSATE
ncbi:MAG TPA: zf-HC2 domain-containing protein [Pyrinomonadaceae bacterium]|nr:zf-HC2 domain-containing protein [Pyrinomonadaceae bacterium]